MARKQSTALVTDLKSTANSLQSFLMEREELFANVCRGVLNSSRLIHMAMAVGRRTPKLLQCSPASWVVALLDASFFGIEPNPQLAEGYLIPYDIKNVGLSVQFQAGYKGLRRLAVDSGSASSIRAFAVYEKDEFSLQPDREWEGRAPFTHTRFRDPKDTKGAGALTDVYVIWKLPGGEREFLHLPKYGPQSIEYYRSRSRAANSGPWSDVGSYPAMAKKTGIRRACDELSINPGTKLGLAMAQEDEFDSEDDPMHMYRFDEKTGSVTPELAEQVERKPKPDEPPPADPDDDGMRDLFG